MAVVVVVGFGKMKLGPNFATNISLLLLLFMMVARLNSARINGDEIESHIAVFRTRVCL